jgi:hypothetical protein
MNGLRWPGLLVVLATAFAGATGASAQLYPD